MFQKWCWSFHGHPTSIDRRKLSSSFDELWDLLSTRNEAKVDGVEPFQQFNMVWNREQKQTCADLFLDFSWCSFRRCCCCCCSCCCCSCACCSCSCWWCIRFKVGSIIHCHFFVSTWISCLTGCWRLLRLEGKPPPQWEWKPTSGWHTMNGFFVFSNQTPIFVGSSWQ